MKRLVFSWRFAGVAVVFFLILLVSFSGSLWFLRALLGEMAGEYTVGYKHSFFAEIPLPDSVQRVRASFIPIISDKYNRFVYKRDAEGEYLVGIPSIQHLFSIGSDLQAQGWQVRRIGWIVLASHTRSKSLPGYNAIDAAGKAVRNLVRERLPFSPSLVLQVGSAGSESFSLHVEETIRGLHAIIHNQSSRFTRGGNVRAAKEKDLNGTTYVALQRDLLSFLPPQFASALEGRISESLGFVKTHPELLEQLSAFGSVGLALEGDSLAVGVISENSQVAALVNQWINAEQGTRHPTKKAFSLPDKTLGYEYIPGTSNAYFDLNKGNNNCFPTEGYDEHLFLCDRDRAVALANKEGVGTRLISFLQDAGMLERGIIQGEVLKGMGISNRFEKIEYIIVDDVIEVWADIKLK